MPTHRRDRVVFLHGLESSVDADLRPIGRKARFLREHFEAELVPLDTRVAQAAAAEATARGDDWSWPFDAYDEVFARPMQHARSAVRDDRPVVVGSSFGGAVALRLLHEGLVSRAVLLAGAGVKLTPFRTLPEGATVHLVHGRRDTVVPPSDSETLAKTSSRATLTLVDDDHRLASVCAPNQLGAWVRALQGAPATG